MVLVLNSGISGLPANLAQRLGRRKKSRVAAADIALPVGRAYPA